MEGYLKKSCVDNNGEKCLGCLGPDGICFFDQKSYEECEEDFISGYKWCEGKNMITINVLSGSLLNPDCPYKTRF